MTKPTVQELLKLCEHVIRKFQDATGPVNQVATALREKLVGEQRERHILDENEACMKRMIAESSNGKE